jgi:PIN domain nuclease of toxin-antitoxin system
VRLLLDTSALLWWAQDDPRLGGDARAAIAEPANDVHVSAVSIWEVEIKRALGRLRVRDDLAVRVAEELEALPVTFAHAVRAGRLPRLHADPFDRMLVAQAQLESMALVTSDREVAQYDVPVLPA